MADIFETAATLLGGGVIVKLAEAIFTHRRAARQQDVTTHEAIIAHWQQRATVLEAQLERAALKADEAERRADEAEMRFSQLDERCKALFQQVQQYAIHAEHMERAQRRIEAYVDELESDKRALVAELEALRPRESAVEPRPRAPSIPSLAAVSADATGRMRPVKP